MKRVRVQPSYNRRGWDVWIYEFRNERTMLVKPIKVEIEHLPEASIFPEPSLFIREEEMVPWVKAIMESLDESGLADRIREDEGVLKATRAHLEDMRNMADKMLNRLCASGASERADVKNEGER